MSGTRPGAPSRAGEFEAPAPAPAERFQAPWADQVAAPSWAEQPEAPARAERFEAPARAEQPEAAARADQTVFRPIPHAEPEDSRSASPRSGDYRDQDFDPYRQRDRYADTQAGPYADDDADLDGGAPAPRRDSRPPGYREPGYREPSPYGRTEPLAYGKARPGSSRGPGPGPGPYDDDRPGPPHGYPDAMAATQPGRRADGGPGKRKKAPVIIGGVVAIAVVAAGSVFLVPKLMPSADPGCTAYAGSALTAYNQTVKDLNARASQARLTQDMTTAIADLNSAAGQARSASAKSALHGLLTELTAIKADVRNGSVPESAVRSLNSAANAADNAC